MLPVGLLGLDATHEESLGAWTKLTASFSLFHLVHEYELHSPMALVLSPHGLSDKTGCVFELYMLPTCWNI